MSGSISPFGPGYGAPYNATAPLQIDPVTGVPLVAPAPAPQAPPGDLPQWAGGSSPNPPPPVAPQMNLSAASPASAAPPPAQLPFQGPGFSPSDITPPGAQAAPAAASQAPAPAPQPTSSDAPPPPPDAISSNSRNNPLNLRYAGQDGATNVNGFAAFPDQASGIAAAKNQFAIDAKRGINTLRGLVSSWAPQNENDTAAYIQNVSKMTGIDPDAKVDITDPAFQAKVMPAMSVMENGPAKGGQAPPVPPGAGPQGGPPQGTPTAPEGQPPAPTDALLASQGFPGISPNAYVGGPGDQLLAIGAGLSGAPSLGKGLSQVGQNELALGQQNRDALIKQAQFRMEQARLQQQMTQQNAILGLRRDTLDNTKQHQAVTEGQADTGLAIKQQGADQGAQRVAQGDQRITQGAQRVDQGAQRVANQTQSLANRFDPTIKANLAQSGETGKQAAEDIQKIQNSRMDDEQAISENAQVQKIIQDNPNMMGQTLAARATRALTEMGLTGSSDANTLDAIQKMTAGARNSYLNSVTNGHLGGMRSFASMDSLSKAVAGVGTNPQAAQFIINLQNHQLQQKMAWRDELDQMQQADPNSVVGYKYGLAKDQFAKNWNSTRPAPQYTDETPSQATPSSGGRPSLASFGSK